MTLNSQLRTYCTLYADRTQCWMTITPGARLNVAWTHIKNSKQTMLVVQVVRTKVSEFIATQYLASTAIGVNHR